jgi:transporter family-2 protein
LARLPAWAWLGGALGAYYVATSIFVAPRLGAANLISITVAAQLFMSLALDHYGLVGFAQHSINVWRILGALLLVAGSLLILRN